MNERDLAKCKVCGALIDKKTGETFVGEDSNAHKIKDLKANYLKLQEDLKRIKEENDNLREKLKDAGKQDNGLEPVENGDDLLGDL